MTQHHKSDAQLQSAALRHYAVKCRLKAQTLADDRADHIIEKEHLLTWAERADNLARTYDTIAAR